MTFIKESTARDRTITSRMDLRPFGSTFTDKAEIKPAIGAFILSSRHPKRLNKHKSNLYEQLNKVVKVPNLAQSFKVDAFVLKIY